MEITYRNLQWQLIFSLSLDVKKARRTLSSMAPDTSSTNEETTPPTGNARSSGKDAEPASLPSIMDKQLISPTPDHTHPVHRTETTVHVAKQNLKRKASGGDQPTKYLVSEAVGSLGYESRAKLGCQLSSLNRLVQRSRKAANRHPSNPKDLDINHQS